MSDLGEALGRRELLSQQYDAQNDASSEPEKVNTPSEPSGERPRGDDGKFVSRETPPKPEPAKVIEAAPVVEQAPKEPPVWERPPKSWKKETHELWAKADPKLREYYVQRENELLATTSRLGSELGPKAKLAESINAVAEPYMNTIRGMGIDLPTAVKGLMEADHALRTLPMDQKRAYLSRLASQYGISLDGMAPALLPGQAPQPSDPNYYALLNQFNSLKGEVLSFKEQQEQAQQAQALDQINKFAATHEYFEELRPTITKLIETGLETDLESAYKHALKINDELSGQVAAAQNAAAQQAQIETANRAAKAAKAAAVSVRGGSPTARPASKAQSRREMLSEAFDGIDSRL